MDGIKRLFALMGSLLMAVFCHGLRQWYAQLIMVKLPPLDRPLYSTKSVTLLECPVSYLSFMKVPIVKCALMRFNKTTSACQIYRTHAADNGKIPTNPGLQEALWKITWTPHLALKRGKMTWRQAQQKCVFMDGGLFYIDSDIKQAKAVEMAIQSGLDSVAIDAYWLKFQWTSIALQEETLNYSAWAEGEPELFQLFAVMAKEKGYKWKATNKEVHGRICQ